MEEQLIIFETAKLIPNPKNSRWWYPCQWFYVDTTTKKGYFMATRGDLDIDYPRPTQSLLQKWLREIHDIHIGMTFFDAKKWKEPLDSYWECRLHYNNAVVSGSTYEEALEKGLQEALKLIK